MKFYVSVTQFYLKSGNSTGGQEVPRTFKTLEEALADITKWMTKHKTSINPKEYKTAVFGHWTTYEWTGVFELNGGKIKDVVTLSYDHTQKE